jgi:kynurenine formamidase
MDTPLHFCADGFALTDLDINCFYFSNPRLIDLPLGDAELIRPGHLEQFESLIGDCDLLLLRTGFGAIRSTDQQRYIMDGPGFSEEGAAYLADSFPDLRCLALDTISLVAMRELDEGIRAHQALLGGGREYLIIEDVNLDQDLSGISEVVALPLMIRGIDGGPCTIVAR